MAPTLQDLFVVSDMDGTLLTDDKRLLPSTLACIRLFTSMGGRFSVATGRGVESVSQYPEMLDMLSPVIANGGTILYDFGTGKALKNTFLPKLMAKKALSDVLEAFPKAGAIVFGADLRNYQVQGSPYAQILFDDEQITVLDRPLEDLPSEWNKILFAGPPDMMNEIEDFVANRPYPGCYFVHTAPIYFEVMPQGVSKGSTLQELCELVGASLENTIVIGDYYNDLEMMKVAGHSVAVSNAPADVSLVADEICVSNNEGGVGQYLYRLVKEYGQG